MFIFHPSNHRLVLDDNGSLHLCHRSIHTNPSRFYWLWCRVRSTCSPCYLLYSTFTIEKRASPVYGLPSFPRQNTRDALFPMCKVYMFQVVLRLEFSFKGSYLQLRRSTFYMVTSMVFVPFVVYITFLLTMYWNQSGCLVPWEPMDFPDKSLDFCVVPISTTMAAGMICGLLWIPFCNVVLAVMFGTKLRFLLTNTNGYSDENEMALKFLIIKNCILSTFGSLSTVINYALWIGSLASGYSMGVGAIFLYIDLWCNSLAIALMFKSAEWTYKRCCRCCILLLLLRFDESDNRLDRDSAIEYVDSTDTAQWDDRMRTYSTSAHANMYVRMDDYRKKNSNKS